ncbi:hypothetical protein TNCV_1734771 [Trichonephila clavipes]|nr:hypothetical protein TNCV_1734771 [Trichonephila clavipes]
MKVSVLLDCPTVSLEVFVAVYDNNEYTFPNMAHKDTLEYVQSLKEIIDADSDDENETNNAAPVPMLSEIRDILKSKRDSSGETNNKMDSIDQSVESAKKVRKKNQIKVSDYVRNRDLKKAHKWIIFMIFSVTQIRIHA